MKDNPSTKPGPIDDLPGKPVAPTGPEWNYIDVRRYLTILEGSLDADLQWVVFEPNNPSLWAKVQSTVEDFLCLQWQSGALKGAQQEQAYFVRCDQTTMTQNDLDNGRLVCEVGVAPVTPAEFVIFRIGKWTADHKGQ